MRNRSIQVIALLLVVQGGAALAQQRFAPVTSLPSDAPEAWAMRYYTLLSQPTSFGPTPRDPPWTFGVGVEGGWVPYLDADQATVGFNGTKLEDVNHTRVFGRLRLSASLPAHLAATVQYVPPVRISGVKPNILSGSVSRGFDVDGVRIDLALFGQVGKVEGAFTCSAAEVAAGNDKSQNYFDCLEPSNDAIQMPLAGVELSVGYPIRLLGGLQPFASVEGSRLFNRFDVHARYDNEIDDSQLRATTTNAAGTLGLALPLGPASIRAEGFYAPLNVRRGGATTDSADGLLNFRGLVELRNLP